MRYMAKYRGPYFIRNIQDELNRIIEDTFGEINLPETEQQKEGRIWRPAVEMKEENDEYTIKAELPGIEKDNIDIEVTEESITIKAETEHKKEEEKENIYKSEFRYGKFMRTIPFPSEVDSLQAKAEYKDGVLKITVPKSEEEHKKIKKIKLTASPD